MCLLEGVHVTHSAAQSGCLCALFLEKQSFDVHICSIFTDTEKPFCCTVLKHCSCLHGQLGTAHNVQHVGQDKPMRITLIIQWKQGGGFISSLDCDVVVPQWTHFLNPALRRSYTNCKVKKQEGIITSRTVVVQSN